MSQEEYTVELLHNLTDDEIWDLEYKALKELEECDNWGDREIGHVQADEVLCDLLESLGFGWVTERWREIPKWYA